MSKDKKNTRNIPKLGKTISKIRNPTNLTLLHDSAYQMFTRPKHVKKAVNNLKNERKVTYYDGEINMDRHDGKVINDYVKGVKNYVTKPNPMHLTPEKYNDDVFTRFYGKHLIDSERQTEQDLARSAELRDQFIDSHIVVNGDIDSGPSLAQRARKALIDNRKLNKKYGYKFEDKPQQLSKPLHDAISKRDRFIVQHEQDVKQKKRDYFINHSPHADAKTNYDGDYRSAQMEYPVKPVKWFDNIKHAKDYDKGINHMYNQAYKVDINYKRNNPKDDEFASSKADLKRLKQHQHQFNKDMKATYKSTAKMSKKLDKKFDKPTKKYKQIMSKYNKIINRELSKKGYLPSSNKGRKMLKNVVGLHHPINKKKYDKRKHRINITKRRKQSHNKKLTKQQQIRYAKNRGQQFK